MAYKFGVGEYLTRDGRKVVIVADNVPGEFPLIGYIVNRYSNNALGWWCADGRSASFQDSTCGLAPPKAWTMVMDDTWWSFFRYRERRFDVSNVRGGETTRSKILDALNAAENGNE